MMNLIESDEDVFASVAKKPSKATDAAAPKPVMFSNDRDMLTKKMELQKVVAESRWLDMDDIAARKLASSHPLEAICARYGRDGYDAALFQALTKFGTSDRMKKAIGRLAMTFPYGMKFDKFNEKAFADLCSVSPVVWDSISSYTDRTSIAVNLFNVKRIFEEKFIYEVMPVDERYLQSGEISLKTSYGVKKLGIETLRDMFTNLQELRDKGQIKQNDDRDQIEFLPFSEAAHAMTLFIIATCSFRIEDGKYTVPVSPYRGNVHVPKRWMSLAENLILDLDGRVPTYHDTQSISASIYSDIYDVLPKDVDLIYREYDAQVKSVYTNKKVIEKDIQAKADEFASEGRQPGAFLDLKQAEKNAYVDPEVFVKDKKKHFDNRNMGGDYSPLGKSTQGAFDVFYYANLARKSYGKNGTWFTQRKGRLIVLGDTIGNRAPVLEYICNRLKAPQLCVEFNSTAKITGAVQKVAFDDCFEKFIDIRYKENEDGEVEQYEESESEDVIFIEGYGVVKKIDPSVPTLSEKEDATDRRILEMARRFSGSYSYNKGDILLLAHNLMHPDKFKLEIEYFQKLKLWAGIIPYPSGDSGSFVWVLYKPALNKTDPDAEKVYDYRLFENTELLKMYKLSMSLGVPCSNSSKFNSREIVKWTMMMIYCYKLEKKVARKGYISGFKPDGGPKMGAKWIQRSDLQAQINPGGMLIERTIVDKRKDRGLEESGTSPLTKKKDSNQNTYVPIREFYTGSPSSPSYLPNRDIQITEIKKLIAINSFERKDDLLAFVIGMRDDERNDLVTVMNASGSPFTDLINCWNEHVARTIAMKD